ncbi:diguanylate cyclase AdrA [Pantoea sp. 1.19]|uniref:diguanylate cyclase AdrA n=1 Tax=Pantoea sp. 1.19 TaxID=1925589 RepID=UPI0009489512|nr:diguanylate cyclase AdrA [Pantoea sp. 1.19]
MRFGFTASAAPSETTRRSGQRFARRVWLPRTLGLALGSGCVYVALPQTDDAGWLWGALLINGWLWPHLALARAWYAKDPLRAEQQNLLFDGLAGGGWIAVMGFNPLPSALIFAMMSMNNVAAGGVRFFTLGAASLALGALIGWLLVRPALQPVSSPEVVWACLPMLIIYPIVLGQITWQTANKLAQQRNRLLEISTHDGMTGIYNRRHWEHLLRNEYDNCLRYQRMATLAIIDIDHFKQINDTFGHDGGDEAILVMTEELRLTLRASDVIGRFGVDEFAVIMPETSAASALLAIDRLRDNLAEHPLPALQGRGLRISVGVAPWAAAMPHHRAWLKAADVALYRAKERGRNRTEVA